MADGTYAPQSPDLSSFLTSSDPRDAPHTSGSYAPRSPVLPPSFTSQQAQPYHQPQNQDPNFIGFSGQGAQVNQGFSGHPQVSRAQNTWNPPTHGYDDTQYNSLDARGQQYMPPIPTLPPSHSFPQQPQQQQFHNAYQPAQPRHYTALSPSEETSPYFNAPSQDYSGQQFEQTSPMAGRAAGARSSRTMVPKMEPERADPQAGGNGLGPSQGIEVKTKFPVARIKRIMQADEEVGKVAQVTPVAVSKALELFMISLVLKSSTVAKTKSSKRITAQHLKLAIEGDEQFDFLTEIVSKVAEGPDAGGKRVKSEDDSEDEGGGGGAKKRRGKGRKKKADE